MKCDIFWYFLLTLILSSCGTLDNNSTNCKAATVCDGTRCKKQYIGYGCETPYRKEWRD